MSKKSTATKTPASSKKSAPSARRSAAARTKLPTTPAEPAPVEAVQAVVTAPVVAEPVAPFARVISGDEFESMVRVAAYQRAEQRGFRDGSPFEDWVRAEADVCGRLQAEGAVIDGR